MKEKISRQSEWFESWFDSPYYHLLYSHRNDDEASKFLDKLIQKLPINPHNSILDLGCGKGRHSLYLASKGLEVTGIDLAQNSIDSAIEDRNQLNSSFPKPEFEVADMRTFELNRKYDFILNLFTSFGYFKSIEDNENVLNQCQKHQNSGGILLIDYFNSLKVIKKGAKDYIKTKGNTTFRIKKYIENQFVKKTISIQSSEGELEFEECVQLFLLEDLKAMLLRHNYEPLAHYGSYLLEDYTQNSNRSILVARKK